MHWRGFASAQEATTDQASKEAANLQTKEFQTWKVEIPGFKTFYGQPGRTKERQAHSWWAVSDASALPLKTTPSVWLIAMQVTCKPAHSTCLVKDKDLYSLHRATLQQASLQRACTYIPHSAVLRRFHLLGSRQISCRREEGFSHATASLQPPQCQ